MRKSNSIQFEPSIILLSVTMLNIDNIKYIKNLDHEEMMEKKGLFKRHFIKK